MTNIFQSDDLPLADDRPSNTLEHFTELELVLKMIDSMEPTDASGFEKAFEQYTEMLTRYQEQPHLLDPHIETLLQRLLKKIYNKEQSVTLMHAAFKYLYIICKVRTYKALIKFLPHELSDMDFVLNLLEKQDPYEFRHWETRYVLLLWMSILVMNPFHMSRLDVYNSNYSVEPKSKMARIYDLCKVYTSTNDTCSHISAYLAAKFFVRFDIKEIYLASFFDWVIDQHSNTKDECKYGQLAAISAILKHGKREDLLIYADKLLQWILSIPFKDGSDFLKYKSAIKIIQRLGLIYLKPRIADWRYKRGTRSLALNLTAENTSMIDGKCNGIENSHNNAEDNHIEDEILVPDVIEDIIEELLQGLRSGSGEIRWSAAKGIGRVTNRLPKELGDEVVGSVMEVLDPLEPHEAWHGGCLALAELAKRGLLLPQRLHEMVPLLMRALFYDEIKGYMSVGQHIRDAACYMCWSFARAYNPDDLQPFVAEISAGLLIVAVFDREINCRRAASAAFQECVGRLGNFSHGIEISTTTDFFTVGLRQKSYLCISDFIAQYEEYRQPLIDHLIERKINHWDTVIRELAAKALHKLSHHAPNYMATVVLNKLLTSTNTIDINSRHGSVLAMGEIILALSELSNETNDDMNINNNRNTKKYNWLSQDVLTHLNELLGKFLERDMFRGISGELMKLCCTDFIRNCSLACMPVTDQCLDSWQQIIDKCLLNKNATIRESATCAFAELCKAYYNNVRYSSNSMNANLVQRYLLYAENAIEEHIRMGYNSALGVLPAFILNKHIDEILNSLIKHSLIPNEDSSKEIQMMQNWSEARRDSVKALSNIMRTIGFKKDDKVTFANSYYLNNILNCLLKAMDEYTLDNRGDIGAWVREAAMHGVYDLISLCPPDLLPSDYIHKIISNFMQQAVEKIDRTRGLAGRLLCQIIHHSPQIPNIRHHEILKQSFPANIRDVLWLFADQTFPIFCSLLSLPDYSQRILLGLSASIGQLTESLMKHSSNAFFQFIYNHPNEVPRLAREIVQNFEDNLLNERITYPMLKFLDIILASGVLHSVLLDENMMFADDIYRLLNLEIKGHKKLYKMVSSVNVYCQLIQVPHLNKKVLSKLCVFLGLTHVHIRKTSATKLYEALALYGDTCGISDEKLEEVLNLLAETDWSEPLIQIRPIRNQLCALIGINPPTSTVRHLGNTSCQQQQQPQ